MRHLTPASITVLWLFAFASQAAAQDTAYVFSTRCFAPPVLSAGQQLGVPGLVQVQLKPGAPVDCVKVDGQTQTLTDEAVSTTYTKKYLDAKLTDSATLSTNAITAIKEAVSENSIKAGEIDGLITSIEERLYTKVLARVRASLEASVNKPATPVKKESTK